MTQLVFFLEEPSAKEALKGILPRIVSDDVRIQYVVFEGKQDLEKRLPIRLRAWRQPNSMFVVLRDKDAGDCVAINKRLVTLCEEAGHNGVLVRIACHELESWYLGDLVAVEKGIGCSKLARLQGNRKYRDPDRLANPAQELKMIVPSYQKVSGSRAIGPHLSLDGNRSTSFQFFVAGLRRLLDNRVNP